MKIVITSRFTAAVLFEHDADDNSLLLTVQKAVALKVSLRVANLGGANLSSADLRGANLDDADLSSADLRGAYLRGANLSSADLRGANLDDADLRDADLRGANLSSADLRDADLRGANLSSAYLRGVPAVPNIDAAILGAIEAGGALDMDAWHTCETTHCRAGWAITLAGNELEQLIGPCAAGALIYAASRPDKRVPDFFASDEDALADIRAGAAA
jgi:uncharacterized protein YjbI with pentapeptide repeats